MLTDCDEELILREVDEEEVLSDWLDELLLLELED